MADVSGNKLRLHLLAEKSLGLSSVPVGRRRKGGARGKGETPSATRASASGPVSAGLPPALPRREAEVVRAPEPPQQPHRVQPAPKVAPAPVQTMLLAGLTAEEGFASPLLPTAEKRVRLQQMDDGEVKGCTFCALCNSRTNTVFGEGDPDARLMFIGEGPGANEDLTGRPFVGEAGQLLDKQIAAMGLERGQVFICNVVKCRPPGNRVPVPDEMAACTPYLLRQVEIVRPEVIVTLGLTATGFLLRTKATMGSLRGNWHAFRGIPVMPTWHPAYLLRNRTVKTRGEVWNDLQLVMARLGLEKKK